jgi:PilZ domain
VNMRFFNRRRSPRRTAHEVVWIEKEPTILERCTLVNVSETGARLTISDVYDLPESFALHLTRESNDGRRCQIIWRRDHEVGVEFLSERPLRKNTSQSHLKDDLRPWRSRKLMIAVRGISGALSAATVAVTNLVPRYRPS